VSSTEPATVSLSAALEMTCRQSRSQLTPAPAMAMLPSSAYCAGSSLPSLYACASYQLSDSI
jgi:hypothetical protein